MKKLFLMGAVALAATMSQASYLYWQVDMNEVTKEGSFGVDLDQAYTFSVRQVGEDSALAVYAYNPNTKTYAEVGNSAAVPSGTASTAHLFAYLGDVAEENQNAYSYYIEITGYRTGSNGEVAWQGVSETQTYAQLSAHIVDNLSAMESLPTAWTGGTYAAPEPTSGLLLLVGASLLALKRRKV